MAFQLIPEDVNHVRAMIRGGGGRRELDKIEGRPYAKAPMNKELGMFKRLKARMFGEASSEPE